MSEQEPSDPLDFKRGRPPQEFPPSTFPTAFADGVTSFVPTAPLVKFYLHRLDPNMFGRGGSVVNPIAQIVMPTVDFVDMVAFFQQQLRRMIREEYVTQAQIDQANASYPDPAPEGGNA